MPPTAPSDGSTQVVAVGIHPSIVEVKSLSRIARSVIRCEILGEVSSSADQHHDGPTGLRAHAKAQPGKCDGRFDEGSAA